MKGSLPLHALFVRRCQSLGVLCCLFLSSVAGAQADLLQERVRALVEQRLPADSRLSDLIVGQPAARIRACAEPRPYLVHPRRLAVGRVAVGVRCADQEEVLGFLQVMVGAQGSYVVSARKIEAGEIIQADMLVSKRGPLQELPKGSALRADQVIGRQAARSIERGAVLALKAVRERWLVERNRPVVLRAQGTGFSLTREGKALDNGGLGNTVRVVSADGRMLSAQVIGQNELLLRY
ncbi:flagellar basal body P-ring formation chaperone FlgA [Pseudomonas sp. Marseille-P9899]|uniref:flagellar basal body P-ring formation chaperone FlgA n=1 Tax=Pseudomonas sp. Marseille-P9899 TaxID=2730401 RepID=UPI00158D3C93|nr:flagellar basal body P-ring formation chaperone FlgA [Pseudomonas sp. Marseille-P9899]